ncbi:MAG: hypothetical protein QX189_13785 [Methylococcales bacterium]
MSFIWNEENIRNLDNEFLRQVISNMEKYNGANSEVKVRFGTTGEKGVRPNYEIVVISRFAYSAISKQHKLEVGQYKDEHLSAENFSLAEIQRACESVD